MRADSKTKTIRVKNQGLTHPSEVDGDTTIVNCSREPFWEGRCLVSRREQLWRTWLSPCLWTDSCNKPQHIAFVFHSPNMEQLASGKRSGYLLSSANWRRLLCMDVGGREGQNWVLRMDDNIVIRKSFHNRSVGGRLPVLMEGIDWIPGFQGFLIGQKQEHRWNEGFIPGVRQRGPEEACRLHVCWWQVSVGQQGRWRKARCEVEASKADGIGRKSWNWSLPVTSLHHVGGFGEGPPALNTEQVQNLQNWGRSSGRSSQSCTHSHGCLPSQGEPPGQWTGAPAARVAPRSECSGRCCTQASHSSCTSLRG